MADHDGGGGAHSAKRSKEVKRYHQRRHQRALRAETLTHDSQLFLFSDPVASPPPGQRGSGNAGAPGLSLCAARGEDGEPVCSTAVPALPAPPQSAATCLHGGSVDDANDWNFEFVFRPKHSPGADAIDGNDAVPCIHENAIVPATFYAELRGEEEAPHGADHLIPVTGWEKKTAAKPLSAIPIAEASASTAPKSLSSIHVKRMDGSVPALPVEAPLEPGTDISEPTSNYLTIDRTYNIHTHAPGFLRNGKASMRSLLSSAAMGWKDVKDSVLVLSTGEAMRAVFQQVYTDAKPLALQAHRIGPTLIIDAPGEPPSSSRERREQALLGKALYRLEDIASHPRVAAAAPAVPSAPAVLAGSNAKDDPAGAGALALPSRRLGPLTAAASPGASRYSQTLRWDFDSLDVLVGVDAPIVLDKRSGTEQMLKLEDVSEAMAPADLQRDALNCWFDATLANVPQVGIYVHNAGVVQSFEVRKVQELLGLVEGRIATAAMNFTSNVLQWLVSECDKDNASYAVLRSYGNGYLELYELSSKGKQDALANLMEDDHRDAGGAAASATCGSSTAPAGTAPSAAGPGQTREEYARVQLGLARMCFGMAQHLCKDDRANKAHEAVTLLLRSFVIFLQQPEAVGSTDHVAETVSMLPSLVACLMRDRLPSSSGSAGPEVLREVLLTCGRFESRLRQAAQDPAISPAKRRRYVRSLLPCSAAFCVVTASALDAFTDQRAKCSKYHAHCESECCAARDTPPCCHRDSPCTTGKDTLQVVAEGLIRLELLNSVVASFMASTTARPSRGSEGDAQAVPHVPLSKGGASASAAAARSADAVKKPKTRTPSARADAACMAVMDPSTDINVGGLEASLSELFGDVVLVSMGDDTPFTVHVLREVSRRISERAGSLGQWTATPSATAAPTTLQWLSTLPSDIVSLSFTALRFYAKAGAQTKRLLAKVAHVHYLLGRHHASTDRYTRALEALHRSRALFNARDTAPESSSFSECFCSSTLVTPSGVQRALGDVYARMADLKARAAAHECTAVVTPHQPLSLGATRCCTTEEDDFTQRAIDAYGEGGWTTQKAIVLVRYAAAQIDTATLQGVPVDQAASNRIFELLSNAAEVSGGTDAARRGTQLLREWELLRLYTATRATEASATLARLAATTGQHWSQRLSGSLIVLPSEEQRNGTNSSARTIGSSDTQDADTSAPDDAAAAPYGRGLCVSTAEQNAQLSLLHCVAAEALSQRARSAEPSTELLAHARSAAAFMVAAIDAALAPPASKASAAHLAVISHVWHTQSTAEWIFRTATLITLRALKAVCAAGRFAGATHRRRQEEAACTLKLLAAYAADAAEGDWADACEGVKRILRTVLQW